VRQDAYSRLFANVTSFYPKLTVQLNANVINIGFVNISGTPKAEYVTYILNGVTHYAFATKEIIISAGAINSAKLLQLSGIGDCAHLLPSLGIPCYHHLPGVGKHLQNQNFWFFGFLPNFDCGTDIPTVFDVIAYADSDGDFQLDSEVEIITDGFPFYAMNIFDLTPAYDTNTATVNIISNSEYKKPLIVFNPFPNGCNYTTEPRVQRAVTFISNILKWVDNMTCPFTRIIPDLGTLPNNPTTDELATWLCSNVGSAFHYAGTTRMGPNTGVNTLNVVDDHLRVYGVNNLRVIDLAAAVNIPATHTQTVAYAIGMNAARLLLTENNS